MTPEEYAAQALIYFLAANGRVPEADHKLFESAVTHYVRAAIEAERERCAQIAEAGLLQIGCTADEAVGVVRRTRDAITTAIRNP